MIETTLTFFSFADLSPANQAPVLLHTAAKCDLLAYSGAARACQLDLCHVVLHSGHLAASGRGPNVDHDHLALGQLLHLALLLPVRRLHAEQPAEQVVRHLVRTVLVWRVSSLLLPFGAGGATHLDLG